MLHLLASQPGPPNEPGLSVPIFTLEAVANARLQRFPEAEAKLREAEQICTSWADPSCGEVIQARGLMFNEKGQLVQARQVFELSLSFARAHGDRFLESTSLLNLGAVLLKQEHFDEAIESSEASYRVSSAIGAGDVALVAQGNVGWAYYKLGDSEKSLEVFQAAEQKAAQLGDIFDQENELTNIGYIYMDSRKFDLAAQSFQRALGLAEGIKAKQDIYNALRVLARLALQTGDVEKASQYAERALAIARESGNHADELYPILVQGQVAARHGDAAAAEHKFHDVEQDKVCPVFLKWEAEHSLARLYEDENQPDSADREYRAALATFEAARDTVRHEDSQLSFLTNASRIYDDYVHFLVARGKTDDALRWADYSRARTLAEGLGLLAKGISTGPPPLNPRQIARRAEGTVLFYWLGEKQSYLWAITPRKTSLLTLPPGSEIDAAVQRYRKALGGPQDVLESADQDGRWLYRTLIVPAQALLGARPSWAKAHLHCRSCGTAEQAAGKVGIRRAGPKGASDCKELTVSLKRCPYTKRNDALIRNTSFSAASKAVPFPDSAFFDASAKVFVVPDGSLNNLNFETLLVSGPKLSDAKLHYWIEDVTIANASSLRVLGASHGGKEKRDRGLLLVGNSVAPNDKYPELPKAAAQMESVARHFPAAEQRIFTRERATPAAYLASSPEQFSYIHFVAHGTASRLSPLDSAIVLSKTVPSEGNAENDSFKLYARDIIRHPLRADLVTISACYGAGERAYSGEGLVGLSWAFLRAGAHNVVAALWEATDASTEQLMDKFYDELDKGAGPDAALRAAKLSLLRGSGFHNPFYWAPFQLYAGSRWGRTNPRGSAKFEVPFSSLR